MKGRGLAEERIRRIYRYMELMREGKPEGRKGSPKELDIKYVKITDPGDTVFHKGDIVSIEALMKEDERVERIGGKGAVGKIHQSPWLTPEQRRELVKEFGHAAVAWAEAVTVPGDLEGVRRAAEFWKRRLREVLGV